MNKISVLVAAILLAFQAQASFLVQGLNEKQIFHGTSLIIRPDYKNGLASHGKATAANFYCFFGLRGYLSFGWWLPATPDADAHHCKPENEEFDWFEYTTSDLQCDDQHCTVHMKNFNNVKHPEEPFFEEDYVFTTVTLGDRGMEQLGWGYFDRDGGPFAFGTRRTVRHEHGSEDECKRALRTLRKIQERRNITDLPFELTDVCGGASNFDQKPLMAFPWTA